MKHNRLLPAAVLCGLLLCNTPAVRATGTDAKQLEAAVAKAVEFCRTSQAADGAYSAEGGPAITAVVTAGLLRSGLSADDPLVAKSLEYLEKFVHSDGGIYADGSTHRNYETCIALQCFHEANRDKRYDELVKSAERFVRGIQWDSEDGIDKASPNFGGAGYGSRRRPDLSNTSFLMDALKSAGAGADDEAVQKALVFVSRCQNLETEHNTTAFAAKVNDGGFYYTPAAGGASMAGETADGGLRSYGSMTYAGLKSLIYAGLTADDPRVKSAVSWVKKHYTLDENPGMGESGLYYYYQAYARALDAMDVDEFKDAAGKSHDWRAELVDAIAKRQQANGSWVNESTAGWKAIRTS